ncbi:hypothetical protein ASPZODRAFT_143982 [Penicilliopsis zonata CBS 506.65]|uniref:F-box domain-containing protein n=1 Tax=Penicilliopsis zonata CBS 506.65 TaxID=1073090 RepID=A0A1L9SE31_9EURO|nr:hypothetical protein ASPZODRAFT_143982 [Penicilliopsis zonata CBS 506.65]OJJ45347.1 hypothetical protein ASPZODRAFT_143982 [Penicilliopsis zonata CBS 506.65]
MDFKSINLKFKRPFLRKRYPLSSIPPEIVGIIFTFLPLPDQICLSLSCRCLYSCFKLFLKSQNKEIPKLLPPQDRPILCLKDSADKNLRIQLLRQLENRQWRYCSGCWFLHPPSAWKSPGPTKPRLSPYRYNCGKWHSRRSCMPYAGEVDLCPCLRISFHDKTHLIMTIKSAREGRGGGGGEEGGGYYNGILRHPEIESGYNFLRHICTFTQHPSAHVKLQTTLSVQAKTESLWVSSRYYFTVKDSQQMLAGSFWVKDPGTWLEQFFTAAGSTFYGWQKKHNIFCRGGHWETCAKRTADPRVFELIVERNLGNGNWPNKQWDRNRN